VLSLITGPTQNILNETEFKNFARVDHTQDDTMILSIVRAAIGFVENETYNDTMPRQWLQCVPGGVSEIELDKGPIISIDEVKYYDDFDSTGELLTESTDFRVVDNYLIHESGYWDKKRARDGYQIKFTSGMFTSTSTNDQRLDTFKTAALKFAYWIYENREMYVAGVSESYAVNYDTDKIPPEISKLLRPNTRDLFL
jgi:uncharacterized phiE125 gp8 family phage protein